MSHDKIYISGKEYPTVIIESEIGTVGYSVNLKTGQLRLICVCAARDKYNCACAYDMVKEIIDDQQNSGK